MREKLDFALSCEDSLVSRVEKSEVKLSCGEDLVLSAGSGSVESGAKVVTGDCASATGESEAYFLQDCKNVLCLGDVGAVVEDDWVAVAEDAPSVTGKDVEKTGVRDGLEKVQTASWVRFLSDSRQIFREGWEMESLCAEGEAH